MHIASVSLTEAMRDIMDISRITLEMKEKGKQA